MNATITLDTAQVAAQLADLDGLIAAAEQAAAGLTAEVARLRGQRAVWQLLADALAQVQAWTD